MNYTLQSFFLNHFLTTVTITHPFGREFTNSWKNAGNFNAVLDEYYYPLLPGAHGEALKSIYQSHLDKIDGFITIGIKENQSSYFIDQFNRAHIPCVILGTDLYGASSFAVLKA